LLLVSLLSASMLIWGIAAYVNYRVTRDEVANLFDAELAQSAKVLLTFVESLHSEGPLSKHWKQDQADELVHAPALADQYERKLAFQLWSEEDGLLLHSERDPKFSVHGFSEKNFDAHLWRVFDEVLQINALRHKYERKIAFQLWSKKNGLLLRSESAPKFSFSTSFNGFSETNID
ncbi:MAG: sensor histidine kinase N-terminal domain-containing protein, partial [Methylobacter sp.]